ncbi:uncharacterized protein LOC127725733 isoform X1 [Mytilus californianus]|uniref:uncharacterized protein LOC127725733 isoform X1 n=2 Tax=Mytilus californianus TaxID=6549 RepID=UPI0022463BB7|nr:uncharacterized protein LOC127725733 isoform X1 [Mytilus californianus]
MSDNIRFGFNMQKNNMAHQSSFYGLLPLPDYDTDDLYEELPDNSPSKEEIKGMKAQRWKEKVNSLARVKSGDAVCFKRTGGLYKHHALVSAVKSGKKRLKIIELSGDSIDCMLGSSSSCGKGSVFETAIDFDKCSTMYKYYYNTERKDGLHPVDVARIFFEEGLPNDYHVKSFNCEHFVSYCITGIPFSKQTRSTNKEAGRLLDEIVKKHLDGSLQDKRSSTTPPLHKTPYLLMDGCNTAYTSVMPGYIGTNRYSGLQRRSFAQRDSTYSGYMELDYLDPCYEDISSYYTVSNNNSYYKTGGFMY